MSITIQMGENPIPKCVISLANYTFENGTLNASFDYTLNSISGYDYWGYGVVLEYGTDESLGNSIALIPISTNRWSAKSGSLSMTKTGVTTTPQNFYFRLNSVVWTEATPGSIGAYPIDIVVDIDKPTEFSSADNFNLEGTARATFSPYKSSYTHILAIDLLTDGNTWVYREGYTSGSTIIISENEILSAYNQINSSSVSLKPLQTVDVKYYLGTYKGDGGWVGSNVAWRKMTVLGTARINIGGSWKNAVPYVRANGVWRPTLSYVRSGSGWKRSSI